MTDEVLTAEVIEETVLAPKMGIDELAVTVPAPPQIVSNLDAINAQVVALADYYAGLSFTDEEIGFAKTSLAALRKVDKAINNKKVEAGKIYKASLTVFENQVKETRAILAPAIDTIDQRVKEFATREEKVRYAALEQMYSDFAPALYAVVPFERIFEHEWITKTGYGVNGKKAADALDAKVVKIAQEYELLDSIEWLEPDDAKRTYLELLDLTATKAADKALHFARENVRELEIQRAEYSAAVPVVEPSDDKVSEQEVKEPENGLRCHTYALEAHGIKEEDKIALVSFLKARGIHGTVKEEL